MGCGAWSSPARILVVKVVDIAEAAGIVMPRIKLLEVPFGDSLIGATASRGISNGSLGAKALWS